MAPPTTAPAVSSKRLLAGLALLACLAGTVGLPLPLRLPDESRPLVVRGCCCPAPEQRNSSCCCSRSGGQAVKSCCGQPSEPAPADARMGLAWVAGPDLSSCRGVHFFIGAAPAAVPPAAPLCWRPGTLPLTFLMAEDEQPHRLVLPFPDPPPRSFPGRVLPTV